MIVPGYLPRILSNYDGINFLFLVLFGVDFWCIQRQPQKLYGIKERIIWNQRKIELQFCCLYFRVSSTLPMILVSG
jgi:hypothetical protein